MLQFQVTRPGPGQRDHLAMMQFIREFAAFGQLPELRYSDQIRKGSHKSSCLLFYPQSVRYCSGRALP
jgi:hypothetical protein